MPRDVVLTEDAERDLAALVEYIARTDTPANANRVLDRVLEVTDSLANKAERGSAPKELRALGITEYRQVFFKPYRIIYRIQANQVVVYVIVDGRREMQALLARRMLGA